jgi:cell fate (sporulation/competence/biofilm development) regulator YlbF (YheA/YmcA/DUF963 family)
MDNGFEDITAKADELGGIIAAHPRTRRYSSALEKMKGDPKAQETYARLVKLGKEIADIKESSKELTDEFIAENDRLRVELTENPIVTEFIESQKDYFELMKDVQDRIRILS